MIASGFTWFHLVPGVGDDTLLAGLGIHEHTYLVITAWAVCIVLVLGALVARASLNSAMARPGLEKYFADDRLTLRTAVEVYGEGIRGLMKGVLTNDDVVKFFPFVAGVFAYIFTSNVAGLVPGVLPPTDNISNNVGMAITVFLVFNAVGLSRDPVGYVKHLMGPVWWLIPLIFAIEVLGLFIRPVTLSLRLTANMFGDHTVFNIVSGLVPWWLPLPAVFLAFGLFVSFIQAFVFSLLSTIYIGLAVPHHDHGDDHGHGHAH
jgi:F-type H+-transporting ATPase subunit a